MCISQLCPFSPPTPMLRRVISRVQMISECLRWNKYINGNSHKPPLGIGCLEDPNNRANDYAINVCFFPFRCSSFAKMTVLSVFFLFSTTGRHTHLPSPQSFSPCSSNSKHFCAPMLMLMKKNGVAPHPFLSCWSTSLFHWWLNGMKWGLHPHMSLRMRLVFDGDQWRFS